MHTRDVSWTEPFEGKADYIASHACSLRSSNHKLFAESYYVECIGCTGVLGLPILSTVSQGGVKAFMGADECE